MNPVTPAQLTSFMIDLIAVCEMHQLRIVATLDEDMHPALYVAESTNDEINMSLSIASENTMEWRDEDLQH